MFHPKLTDHITSFMNVNYVVISHVHSYQLLLGPSFPIIDCQGVGWVFLNSAIAVGDRLLQRLLLSKDQQFLGAKFWTLGLWPFKGGRLTRSLRDENESWLLNTYKSWDDPASIWSKMDVCRTPKKVEGSLDTDLGIPASYFCPIKVRFWCQSIAWPFYALVEGHLTIPRKVTVKLRFHLLYPISGGPKKPSYFATSHTEYREDLQGGPLRSLWLEVWDP